MNCEIGLLFDFDVDENGIPSGCPGFEHFSADVGNPCQIDWAKDPTMGQRGHANCAKHRNLEPPGSTPVSKIMENYSNSQTAWINDYIKEHEKRKRNGYQME